MSDKTKFKIGDWVVHTFHGVGKVEDIVEKNLDGDEKQFYKVHTKNMDYWIPFGGENVDHIEPIRTKKDFENAVRILSNIPVELSEHHKGRMKDIQDRWQEGSLEARAELLRDLHARHVSYKLNFNEKELMEKIISFMVNEWIIADKKVSKNQAKMRIQQALNESVKNIGY